MSRAALPRLYRQLLRTCAGLDPSHYGQSENNLALHVMYRVRTEKALELDGLKDYETVPEARLEEAARMLEGVEAVLSEMSLMEPSDAPSLFSFLTAAHAQAGSPAYHRELESGLLQIAEFHTAFQERLKLEETRNGEMKNRALQIAARQHADLLKILEDGLFELANPGKAPAKGWQDRVRDEDLQMTWHFFELPELVAVGVDNERQRVKIAIASHLDIRDNAFDEHVQMQDWGIEPEGVTFTADYNIAAAKIVGTLMEHNVLPEGHSYTLTGHSIGGALAVIIGAYLRAEHTRDIVNIVTFGQPRVTDNIGSAALTDLPTLRIVTPLDGFQHTPTASAAGKPFQAYGEQLSLLPVKLKDIADEAFIEENQLYVTMSEYQLLMHEDTAVLEWTPEPEHLAYNQAFQNLDKHDPDEVARAKMQDYKARTPKKSRSGSYDPTANWK
eukprot:TRINITY_DN20993_c0_g1_i1.p1 TRINITY_DN20993_c0_g1~~TRINITY_DN20993_c0_g1_i1.p1  ORF type:complete len:475 (+),score=187.11 TRINITY_DN20993_c0_g1_i1:96-1427(+)